MRMRRSRACETPEASASHAMSLRFEREIMVFASDGALRHVNCITEL